MMAPEADLVAPRHVAFVSQPRDGLQASGRQSGSVAIVLAELVKALGERVRATAVGPIKPGQASIEHADRGYPIHRVEAGSRNLEKLLELLDPRPLPRLMSPAYYRGYFERAAAALVPLRPDIVHLMTSAAAGPVFRRALPGVPLVLHLHDDMLTRIDPALAARQVEPFAAVVTCSRWLSETLKARLPSHADRIWPIGNGIDPELFSQNQEERRPRPIRKLIMVGRVSPEKGPHVLLEAFARLAPAYPDLTLELVGPVGLLPLGHARLMAENTPSMAETVRRFYGRGAAAMVSQFWRPGPTLVQRLLALVPPQLRQRVSLTGPQPHDRLAAIYQDADLLIQPSVCREGYGLPVAEAMASGLPVVASGHGGLLDLVDDGTTGLLVPPGDPEALARAIARLLDDPARTHSLGQAGRVQAMASLTWQCAAARLAEVYARLPAQDAA
ncbi:MAG TPA: glycosyltransferase family 4 protein [Geminicoccus sp.]|uniref:glycosyltransferase family 4 protein n=1 Tax=Geminicoccus sp. TaxID=2024832 RepID=UPI002E30C8BA|nr:glycosyltransferase family 4 protein [Geminicoccus sp.]HEX2529686.1 glycosyltransferase family 4 protein [Geminicoccus sp.]